MPNPDPGADLFDVIVIGGGPAGYPAAIRAAQNKLRVACIDEWTNRDGSGTFGGTCLNAGCIPSKALLESTELLHRARHEFATHGLKTEISVDLATMQKRRARIVKTMTGGILALFKSAGVTPLRGHGRLLPGLRVEYTAADGVVCELAARDVVLASGSSPMALPTAPFDGVHIIDSWGALELEAIPRRLGVIGAGVIGLELGSVWRRLGSEVVMLEALPEFLAIADQQLAQEALRHFRKLGLDIRLGARVTGATVRGEEVTVAFTDAQGGAQSLAVDTLVVAIGRRPYTVGLLAPGTGVELNARGFIEVDHQCRTADAHVWAVGDCVRGPMLAHKGKEEGTMVADLIAGRYGEVNYHTVPSVIYTAPEIAWVGATEEQVKATGRAYKVGVFPFAADGRARAMEATGGFVKLIAAADNDEILGVHIIGPLAGELIAEAVLALEYSASAEDLQRTIHAHPTLSEALHEAALAADKRSIDSINKH
jgi:dihydrolipoamide dehydrogenase